MKRTYKIIDVKLTHPTEGVLLKQNIIYLVEGKELTHEFYTGDPSDIREGYEPCDEKQPKAGSELLLLLDKATPEELAIIKQKINT